jgi:hypothetical protein
MEQIRSTQKIINNGLNATIDAARGLNFLGSVIGTHAREILYEGAKTLAIRCGIIAVGIIVASAAAYYAYTQRDSKFG